MAEEVEVSKLVVALEARTKQMESALKRVEKITKDSTSIMEGSLKRVSQVTEQTGSKMGTVFGKLEGVYKRFLGVLTVGVLSRWGLNAVKSLGAVGDEAERLQLSTDLLQAVAFSVEQAGGSFENASKGLAKFSIELGKANSEESELARFLTVNGIALRDQNGALRDTTSLFQDYARLVANARSPQEALNFAGIAFGDKVGPKMVTTLKQIASEGLGPFIQRLKEAGLVVEEDLVKRADTISDKWDELWTWLDKRGGEGITQIARNIEKDGQMISSAWERIMATMKQAQTDAKTRELTGLENDLADARNTAAMSGLDLDRQRVTLIEQRIRLLREELNVAREAASVPRIPEFGLSPEGRALLNPPPATKPPPPVPTKGPKSEWDQATEAIERHTRALAEDAATVGMSEAAAERYTTMQRLMNALTDDGVKITAAHIEKMEAIAEKVRAAAQAAEDAKNKWKGFHDTLQFAGDIMVDAIQGLIERTQTWADMLKNVQSLLLKAALQAAILGEGPFGRLLGFAGTGGGTGGLLGLFGSLFGGGRASGGPVTAGRAYEVGERGRELFVPKSDGFIVPMRDRAPMPIAMPPQSPTWSTVPRMSPQHPEQLERSSRPDIAMRATLDRLSDVIGRFTSTALPIGTAVSQGDDAATDRVNRADTPLRSTLDRLSGVMQRFAETAIAPPRTDGLIENARHRPADVPQVIINNQVGGEVHTEQRRRQQGGASVVDTIVTIMKKEIVGGGLDKEFGGRYGMRPGLRRA